MTDDRRLEPLSPEELEGQTGEELPDREVMTTLPIDGSGFELFVPADERRGAYPAV